MNKLTASALARTLLLMRDDLYPAVTDELLLEALGSTVVVLTADEANLSSHSAQSAFVTAAMLMARSAHQVHLLAPDVRLVEPQPPLIGDRLVTALVATNDNLVPGVRLSARPPAARPSLEIRFGDTPSWVRAERSVILAASGWAGAIVDAGSPWPRLDLPFGGLAAAALASGEAFKVSMMKLFRAALNPEVFKARFAPCQRARIDVAPADTPFSGDLQVFDVISGGAIANSFLYSLLRARQARGSGCVIDSDIGDISNLNRNVLMLYSDVQSQKVAFLADCFTGGVTLNPIATRFERAVTGRINPNSRVIVGVDHIPTRWVAQACNPFWLGIGATSHWSAMASYHAAGVACARCLHAQDDPDDAPIPTVAFVSFWAGLLLAGYFAQSLAMRHYASAQQTYLTPLRPEMPWRTAVGRRPDCPLCRSDCDSSRGLVTRRPPKAYTTSWR
jgi:hypothetical protein